MVGCPTGACATPAANVERATHRSIVRDPTHRFSTHTNMSSEADYAAEFAAGVATQDTEAAAPSAATPPQPADASTAASAPAPTDATAVQADDVAVAVDGSPDVASPQADGAQEHHVPVKPVHYQSAIVRHVTPQLSSSPMQSQSFAIGVRNRHTGGRRVSISENALMDMHKPERLVELEKFREDLANDAVSLKSRLVGNLMYGAQQTAQQAELPHHTHKVRCWCCGGCCGGQLPCVHAGHQLTWTVVRATAAPPSR